MEVRYYTFEEALSEKGYIIYTNVGTSMLPLLRQRRDIIEIHKKDPTTRCKRYDVVLYKRGNKYILHRILKVRTNDYVISGDHNIWREYGITDAQILGVMTRVIRDGKSIDVSTNRLYKLYVHLWCDFYHVRVAILYLKRLAYAALRKVKRLLKPAVPKDGGEEADE
ncbi:MAG: S24/S26 family peptidase [Clostridia bacterium]|nr:S24/S26 family peptidase [Clostridia bacterium]